MRKYHIAGLCAEINTENPRFIRQAEEYLAEDGARTDMAVSVEERYAAKIRDARPEERENLEMFYLCWSFARKLLEHDALVLHASAVVLDGRAYLFSADSGTGKSTHTSLWVRHFGAGRAYILNDDTPVVRNFPGGFQACGSPFSGSSGIGRNGRAPLAGICFLERAQEGWVRRADVFEAFPLLIAQTLRVNEPDLAEKQLATLDRLFTRVPVYRMGCGMDRQAVELAWGAMRGEAAEG